jgi:hypothetical protein
MAIIDDEEAMFETLDPVPSEIATAISDGLNAFNESAEIRREAFDIVWRESGGLAGGITASVSFSVLFHRQSVGQKIAAPERDRSDADGGGGRRRAPPRRRHGLRRHALDPGA